ncbi:MAG: efflux RND transporter periplasmic adaptor subunit, partial [Calditrichaeota bacterium]|nr:efflux RND transporter periplasmic adaptor subunit [Calditrichota bacterium]
ARLEYEKLLADYNRLKALQAEELLSEEEFLTAEINMKQAEIAWEQAKLNLEYTTVTAPISGVIGDRLVNLGDRIQTSTNLFTIANLNEKIVRLYVPQSEFAKCYKNQTAKVTTDVMAGTKFNGYVKRISPIIDPQSGTFKVTIAVKDPQNKLRPGMFVNAELIVDTHENAKLIPKSALIYENERTYFFIVSQDSSQKLELKKGFEDAEKVEILNDLEAGTQIVVLGQNGLKDGSRVKIVEEKKYRWQANGETSGISALLPRR